MKMKRQKETAAEKYSKRNKKKINRRAQQQTCADQRMIR